MCAAAWFWWIVACALLAFTLIYMAQAMYIRRIVGALTGSPLPPDVPAGRVSVIVAARDEARRLAAAADSLLAQDHPGLEFIFVDDRSTDGTGALMDARAATDHRVRVVHVKELPDGWLGKNHALWLGAQHAKGDWLLFIDGDVCLAPGAVRRAVAHATERGLDHLTVGPALLARGFWLQTWVAFTVMIILTFLSPRRMNGTGGRGGFGIGAFNLVRRSAYQAIGTHRAIALRPDDDVRLGMRLRRAGCRQWAAAEPDLVFVEWYGSLRQALCGLDKNAFAVLDYRPAAMAAAVLACLVMFTGPLCGAVLLRGGVAWAFRAVFLLQWATVHFYARTFVRVGRRPRALAVSLAYPLGALLYAYAMARSGWLALTRGGITWRGTRYDLGRLRGHTGLEL